MGVFCPTSTIAPDTMARIERDIIVPTVDALRRDGIEFRGVLYTGIMLTHSGPKVLEYNTRFGDPECQPLMARLRSALLELLLAACDGRLHEIDVRWDERPACCVVLASEGYPEKPRTGDVIHGIDEAAELPDVFVFHSGTRRNAQGDIVTAGGRVLSVTALGETMQAARARAYEACERIVYSGKTFRTDIAAGI